MAVSIEVGGSNKCFMVSLRSCRMRGARTCDDAPHGETFLLPTPARRWPGAGSQTPSSIRCGPIAAQANRKRAARWTTFKARLRLRESTSHRNYRARCAGDLGCTGTLRWRASSSLRHSGPKLPLLRPECQLQNINDVTARECTVTSQMQPRTRSFQPGGS